MKKRKYAVLTIAIGEKFQQIAKLTHPTLKFYSDKIGADFIVIDKDDPNLPHWNKFEIFNLLKTYQRIIYFDTDIIVREDCPNLFDIVPEKKLGLFNEGRFDNRLGSMQEACKAYREDLPKWDGTYYNTGVMVVSKYHRSLFKTPEKIIDLGMYEQPYLNLRILKDDYKVHELEYKFNRMTILDPLTGEPRHASYIIHYAGAPNQFELLRVISEDLEEWKNKKQSGWEYKRNIIITVGGGLGDQLCAEPVARYVINKIYPNQNIIIITHWPRLFKHLNVPCMKQEDYNMNPIKGPVYIMETMPDVNKPVWAFITHTLSHSIDFSSIAAIHRIIPDEDKTIKLQTSPDGMREIYEIIDDINEYVLVHPGRGWPSKTFPEKWWNDVIKGLKDSGLKVAVIGKHISDEQGYVDVEIPKDVVDLRDMLTLEGLIGAISQARVLISNDSAPIHIAGAFDNFIILIPTCKHPDMVLPYRFGSKSYKTKSLYKKLTVDYIDSSPTMVHGQTLDYVNGDIMDYLPDPEVVVEETKKLF